MSVCAALNIFFLASVNKVPYRPEPQIKQANMQFKTLFFLITQICSPGGSTALEAHE